MKNVIEFYILKNKNNLQATITNYGARWVNMMVPDKNKNLVNIIVGFSSVETYKNPSAIFYGAIIGRYANRIAGGKFFINEIQYQLDINNGNNHLHGGTKGFYAVIWEVIEVNENSLLLQYISKDGEEGYPGNLKVTVRYTLTDDNTLQIDFTAATDQSTILNLTAHPYFNLNGAGSGTILEHSLIIYADAYIPIDQNAIPTGEIKSVNDSPFDFTKPKKIGEEISNNDIQLQYGRGYDHNFVLNKNDSQLTLAATLNGDISNIKMDVLTTEPGLQFYSGNFMDGTNIMTEGYTDDYRTALCLEPQHFPDSPNQPVFPTTLLLPEQKYKSSIEYRFS